MDSLLEVVHDLKTVFTALKGYTHLILQEDFGPINPEQQNALYIMHSQLIRAQEILGDLLEQEPLCKNEPQELGQLLKECFNMFYPQAIEKGIDLRYAWDGKEIFVQGDSLRLTQIFMNLISNSIKYTKSGFVELRITQSVSSSGVPVAAIHVQDSGIGIGPEELSQIFKKFYRSPSALGSQEDGSGLGLVFIKRWVEKQNGWISVSSTLGIGTEFVVEFPSIEEPLVTDSAQSPESDFVQVPELLSIEAGQKKKVLLAEDDEAIAQLIQYKLQCLGYTVEVAKNGEEAMKLLQNSKWDLVILDANMPILSGWEVLEKLQEMGQKEIGPIVMLSASAKKKDPQRAKKMGAIEFFHKPFHPDQLNEKLAKLLGAAVQVVP